MIHEYKTRKRILFFPTAWANSVSRWLLGVHSSDGSLTIKNTANPGEDGSIDLCVNFEAVYRRVRELFDTSDMSDGERERVKEIIHGMIDGISIKLNGSHIGVDIDWLTEQIIKQIKNELPAPEQPASPAQIVSGIENTVGAGSTSLLTDNATIDGENGAELYVVERAHNNGMNVRLFWRKLTFAADGRLVKIGPEQAMKDVANA